MRSMFPFVFAAAQAASAFTISPAIAAKNSGPTPMLCSTAFDWYGKTYLGIKGDGTLPAGYEKSTYDYEGLKKSLGIARKHLSDLVQSKKLKPEVLAEIKPHYEAYDQLDSQRARHEFEIREFSARLEESHRRDGGAGLSELRSRTQADLESERKKLESVKVELRKMREPLIEMLKKAGAADYGRGLVADTSEEKQFEKALQLTPAARALNDIRHVGRMWDDSDSLRNAEVTVIAPAAKTQEPKKQMTTEEQRKMMALSAKVDLLRRGLRQYPDSKAMQEELKRGEETLKGVDLPNRWGPYGGDSFPQTTEGLKTVMVRKNGIPHYMILGNLKFTCDESGQVTSVTDYGSSVQAKDCVPDKKGKMSYDYDQKICFLYFSGPNPPEPTPAPPAAKPGSGAIK